jgi:hypothetical protein
MEGWGEVEDDSGFRRSGVVTSPPPSSLYLLFLLATGLVGDDTYLSSSY